MLLGEKNQNQQTTDTDIAMKPKRDHAPKLHNHFEHYRLQIADMQKSMLCFCSYAWLPLVLRILVISIPVASGKCSVDSECSTLVIRPLGQAVLV